MGRTLSEMSLDDNEIPELRSAVLAYTLKPQRYFPIELAYSLPKLAFRT